MSHRNAGIPPSPVDRFGFPRRDRNHPEGGPPPPLHRRRDTPAGTCPLDRGETTPQRADPEPAATFEQLAISVFYRLPTTDCRLLLGRQHRPGIDVAAVDLDREVEMRAARSAG